LPRPARLPSLFTPAEAARHGFGGHALRRLLRDGEVEVVTRGVYKRTDVEIAELEYAAIAARAPEATICLTTALARHALIDMIPPRIDIALPQGRWLPRLGMPVTWHKFARATFDVGRESIAVDGRRIGLYDAPRSIIDTFRLRHLEGHELAVEALRNWIRKRGSRPALLVSMAHRIDPRTETTIRKALEILL
jgi:predicted transcriptional regulator of viral defense system